MKNINFQADFDIKYAKLALDSISIYRNLLQDKVIGSLKNFLDYIDRGEVNIESIANLYNGFFFNLTESGYFSLKNYIIDKIIFSENYFSLSAERGSFKGNENMIKDAAAKDLEKFQCAAELSFFNIRGQLLKCFDKDLFKKIIEEFPQLEMEDDFKEENYPRHISSIEKSFHCSSKWSKCIDDLAEFHNVYGCGIFANYRAFVWEHIDGKGCFKGIEDPDPIELSDLIGYEKEHLIVEKNTIQFLEGFPANNVLIHGDRGTGKSSTVKAILNKYYTRGLRMVELPKAYLEDFPEIIRKLKNKSEKFIIFVDDLVFSDNEESYTALKSMLEGGFENKSSNILIYATSNRRHLVKEYFSERGASDFDEEVHREDSVQEKLSLADRFGINVVFISPDKVKYLQIVEGIAKKRKLNIDRERLYSEALKWERWYNGRSARTARQFVDWIEGCQEKF
ncbi:ATP-binding protein [Clostridium sp. Mt-5]|uniref:ATP-binding protein n=1 Tax=Clostridium moutaii TaxID=3240932 RepID=A0ABV4BV15_9CLOT